MMNEYKNWIGLFVLCLLVVGCGGEEPAAEVDAVPEAPDEIPTQTEVIVEPSEAALFVDGELRPSVGLVSKLLLDESIDYPVSAEIESPDKQDSPTRVRFMVKVGSINGRISQNTIKVLADQVYNVLKTEFEARTKQALLDELAYQQAQAQAASTSVKALQQALQAFQEARRGLPQTDASRLERRKLERQIENALQAQIDADKIVASLQKKIDRGRHVTLQRVR